MKGRVIINSLPQAFRVIKGMNVSIEGWESDYWVVGCESVRETVKQQMRDLVSWYWMGWY